MGGRRDYTRWDYDDETEITMDMEEQLTLEDQNGSHGGSAETLSNATFPPPNVRSSSSPLQIRSRESCKRSRKTSIKEKVSKMIL